jgi:hypothetical protein
VLQWLRANGCPVELGLNDYQLTCVFEPPRHSSAEDTANDKDDGEDDGNNAADNNGSGLLTVDDTNAMHSAAVEFICEQMQPPRSRSSCSRTTRPRCAPSTRATPARRSTSTP